MAWMKIGDTTFHICQRGQRSARCKFCSHGYVDKLCDFPVGPRGKTCDAGMCNRCATNIAPEVDYCPRHKGLQPAQTSLDLANAEEAR